VSEPQGPDPLDELRRVDPVDMDQLPSASLARMSARIQEKIVDTKDTGTGRRRFMMPAAAVVLAGIALIVVVAGMVDVAEWRVGVIGSMHMGVVMGMVVRDVVMGCRIMSGFMVLQRNRDRRFR